MCDCYALPECSKTKLIKTHAGWEGLGDNIYSLFYEFMFLNFFLYFGFLYKKYVRPVFNNFFKPDIFEVSNISMFRHYCSLDWYGPVNNE